MHPQVRPCNLDDIIDLRQAVLRRGLPRETALFPEDDAPTSRHFAAFIHDQRVIGCLTLHLSTWSDQGAYQLRGMAVAPAHRRKGIGSELLEAAEAFVVTTPLRILWCNARTPSTPFYTAHGWTVASAPFEIPTAGPHVKMLRVLK